MFLHMTLAVIFSNKLSSAIIARVWPHTFMGIHMCNVICLSYKSAFALITPKWFGSSCCVCPFVQLQVPLCGEIFIANQASVWPLATMITNVHFQRGAQINTFANGTFDIFSAPFFFRYETIIVGSFACVSLNSPCV